MISRFLNLGIYIFFMIVNEYNNKVSRKGYSKTITVDDDGDGTTYVFPNTSEFLAEIQRKRNAEKLYKILNRYK